MNLGGGGGEDLKGQAVPKYIPACQVCHLNTCKHVKVKKKKKKGLLLLGNILIPPTHPHTITSSVHVTLQG